MRTSKDDVALRQVNDDEIMQTVIEWQFFNLVLSDRDDKYGVVVIDHLPWRFLMSNESDFKAQLVASVIIELYGIQQNAQDLVEALNLEALGGSRKAKDTLANPWNSSVPPSRRKQEIETQLDYVRGILDKHGPIFFAAALEEMRLEKQREYQRDREKGAGPIDVKDGLAWVDPGYARIINILRDQARVSNRDAERASVETIIKAGRVIKRHTEDRWCDHVVSVRELSQARVLQHVSVPVGWSLATGKVWYTERAGDYWHHDPVTNTLRAEPAPDPYFDSKRCQTILPTPLNIDPPGLPRAWTPDSAAEMHSVLWDALPDEPFYRSSSNRVGCKRFLRCRCREHGRLRGRHVPPHDGASRATLPRFTTHFDCRLA